MHVELVAIKLVTVVLGLLISYQAYRGYRRNGVTELLYVGVGFALISVGGVLEGILFELFDFSITDAGVIATLLVAAGMCCILYSLYGQS